MMLPLLGGGPSIWNTAMMLFQALLLAGYAYAHLLGRLTTLPRQILTHGLVLVIGLAFLPIAVDHVSEPPAGRNPVFWFVSASVLSVGWPFFALSASAPLLQAWFSNGRHPSATDPYFLYAASNLGSLMALLSFPLALEPTVSLTGQGKLWAAGYLLLLALLLTSCAMLLPSAATRPRVIPEIIKPNDSIISWRQRFTWVCLAFVPSSLLLGVTSYITTDVGSAPLLWVIPLSLYLITFTIAFGRQPLMARRWAPRAQEMGIVLIFINALFAANGLFLLLTLLIHLSVFFLTGLRFHTELAHQRPDVSRLTEFYFCLSVGGAAGGVFNALIAPLIFSGPYEYYIVLIASCALRLLFRGESAPNWNDILLPALSSMAIAALLHFTNLTKFIGVPGSFTLLVFVRPDHLLVSGSTDKICACIPIWLEQVAQPPREAAGHGWRRRARCLSLADRR